MSEQKEQDVKPNDKAKQSIRWVNVGILFSTIATVTFVASFGYGYYELAKVNMGLAQAVQTLQTQAIDNSNQMATMQESVGRLSKMAQSSDELTKQQERFMADWQSAQQGDLSKWYLAEAMYLVRIADNEIRYSNNTQLALTLLRHADETLGNVSGVDTKSLQEAVTNDIEKLDSAGQPDISTIFIKLSALDIAVGQLSLPATPLHADQSTAVIDPNLPWWNRGLQTAWQALKGIIVVQYNGKQSLPLVLPKEKSYLYQNLHSQVQNAMWAALNRNEKVYQVSLINIDNWIQLYFNMNDKQTQKVLADLETLKAIRLDPPLKDISSTVKLFNEFMANTPSRPA